MSSEETIKKNGVTIVGEPNLPSLVPYHASEMYSKNILNLINYMSKEGKIELNLEDEIVKGSLITYKGEVINDRVKELINAG